MEHALESVIILFDCESNVPASEIEDWFESRGRSTVRTDDVIQAISLAMDECGQDRPDVVLLETNRLLVDYELVTELSGMFSCGRNVRVSLLPTLSESSQNTPQPLQPDAVSWLTVAFG